MTDQFGLGALLDPKAKRILLVSGDVKRADAVGQALRDAGFSVENAYSAGDALAAVYARYALVIVDGNMRDRQGHYVLELLRARPDFLAMPTLSLESLLRGDPGRMVSQVRATLTLHDSGPTSPGASPVPADAELSQKLAALKALSALGRTIASVLDLSQALNQIVEAATALTSAEEGLLLLPDDEEQTLYLRARKGLDDASARNFRVKNTEPLVGGVYRTGEPVLVGEQGLLRIKTQYFVKSMLYVPMKYQGRVIGVLGVHRHTEGLFTQTDLELLQDLAAHAAIAIENARLYEDRLRQNRQLTMLVDAGMALNATLAPADVLGTLSAQVFKTLSVSHCELHRLDADGPDQPERLAPLSRTVQAVWRVGQGSRVRFEERPPLRRVLEGNTFYLVSADERSLKTEYETLLQAGASGLLVLPVRASGQEVIGVLELFYRDPMPEVSAEFRARARGLAAEICATAADQDARTATRVFQSARQLLEMTGAAWFCLSLRGGDNIQRLVEYGGAHFLDAPLPLLRPAMPERLRSLQNRTPVRLDGRDPNLSTEARAWLNAQQAENALVLPILTKGQAFGTLTLCRVTDNRPFQVDETNLAWALIAQAAAAIDNASLYSELQRSLTDLKLAQASLVQAARLSTMGQLAAVVAHQINNPLTTVIVDSELILGDMEADHPMREGVMAIHRAGKRAHGVVRRLLSTARRDNPSDMLQWVEVNQTIQNTLELVSLHIERRNITLQVHLDPTASHLRATPGHLEDVWLNLLLNGRDALANVRNARLTINSVRIDDMLEVAVADNGPGIPPELLANIFEPFFTTKPAGEGTGLGLYICKQVVDQCGGRLTVESEAGRGTIFRVRLPVFSTPT